MHKTNRTGKLLAVIIAIIAIGAALYFYANKDNPLSTVSSASTRENGAELDPVSTITETTQTPKVSITASPSINPESTSLISSKNLTFFIDKNRDLVKNSDEANCDKCKGKNILIGTQEVEGSQIKNSLEIKIASDIKIPDTKAMDGNVIWAVLSDVSLMIPPTVYAFGDGGSDIQVPVWEITGVVAGVNANITSASAGDESVTYNFSKLIPSMKTAFEKQEDVWVKFTPSLSREGFYYLSKNKLNNAEAGYSLNAGWSVASDSSNLLSVENVQFVVR